MQHIMYLNLNLFTLQHVPIHTSLDECSMLVPKHSLSCFLFSQHLDISEPFVQLSCVLILIRKTCNIKVKRKQHNTQQKSSQVLIQLHDLAAVLFWIALY